MRTYTTKPLLLTSPFQATELESVWIHQKENLQGQLVFEVGYEVFRGKTRPPSAILTC